MNMVGFAGSRDQWGGTRMKLVH